MGFFRDLGRIKARNRRMHGEHAVVSFTETWEILLKRDDPLEGVDFTSEQDDGSSIETFTLNELQEFGDGLDGNPIYISVFGRVYDVSAGEKYYGEDGSYGMFAGKDVTRGLCLGCKAEECLVRSTEGLTEKQLDEGKRWLSFFQLHDKYQFVGKLEGEDSEAWLDALVETTINSNNDSDQGTPFNPELEADVDSEADKTREGDDVHKSEPPTVSSPIS
jgi:membrane-associated progesterone receptor component